MISSERIGELVDEHIETLRIFKRDHSLVPKRATIISSSDIGLNLGYVPGEVFIEIGTSHSISDRFPQRAVFRPQPIHVFGQTYYLEIKGYGADGRHLIPIHHSEGDLNYGMYFTNAKREYDFLETMSYERDLIVQHPVSLSRFSHDEFVHHAIGGLVHIIFPVDVRKGLASTQKGRDFFDKHGDDEVKNRESLNRLYFNEGLEAVLDVLNPFVRLYNSHLLEEFPKISNPAGYFVRASRCPFRICFGKDKGISEDDLNEAAFEAGRTYRRMVEKGIWHHVPSQGNITLSGELMDFEDASLFTDFDLIRESWDFMRSNSLLRSRASAIDVKSYIALTLGDEFLGPFVKPFLEGTGLGLIPEEAASSVVEMRRSDLGELVDEVRNFV